MNFVSVEQLMRDAKVWTQALPPFRLVAGVEESGMIPARMLARAWFCEAVPLAEVAGKDGQGVLVVDDSMNFGGAMTLARKTAKGSGFKFAAVYVAESSPLNLVDYYFRVLPHPRIFQWNIWKHDLMASACIDMDGVICEDCIPEWNDDGPGYANFLENARPLHIPKVQVAAIVTGRLEKYRKQTEAWLERYGVRHTKLVMMPFSYPPQRREYGIARFKAETYVDPVYRLFVESGPEQAVEIAIMTGKPVLSVEESKEWRMHCLKSLSPALNMEMARPISRAEGRSTSTSSTRE